MFEALTQRLEVIFDRLRGAGRLTEENIQEALREVRVALLEADVNFKVVRAFIERVRAKAVGQDVLQSLTPGQQVVKVVHDELVELLGGAAPPAHDGPAAADRDHAAGPAGVRQDDERRQARPPLPAQGYQPLLAAADIYRPAAIEQLRVLGGELGVPVHGTEGRPPG